MCHIFANLEKSSALHQNRVEFHQEFNGYGPIHVTRVFHVSDTCFSFWYSTVCHIFATLVLDEKNGHVLHQNGLEFHQEFNGYGPRHVFFISVQYSVPYFCKFLTSNWEPILD